jgi:hypothetical protein
VLLVATAGTPSRCCSLPNSPYQHGLREPTLCTYAVQTAVGCVRPCGQGGTTIRRRVDVKQAAEMLGISSEGIRQRIRRGSLESEKDSDGRVYVFLDEEAIDGAASERDTDTVITRLEDEVAFLRQELATRDEEIRRRDAVLLSLSEGLKALNPPPEPRESPETTSDESSGRGERMKPREGSGARGGSGGLEGAALE